MKKFILSLIAIAGIAAVSQAQIKLGIKAGANSSNQRISTSQGGSLYAGENVIGYQAGFIADVKLTDHLYLQPQLLWDRKGAEHFSSLESGKSSIKINYIDLPVNLVYKFDLSFGKIFVGAGASFSYAVSGKSEKNGHTTDFFATDHNWNRTDLALSFTAGLEFNNGLFMSINSQRGLLDIYSTDAMSVRNKSTSLTVGYLINWKNRN